MPSYKITWEIDIDADTPEAAAEEAFAAMQDPDTIATVFLVEHEGRRYCIDLKPDAGGPRVQQLATGDAASKLTDDKKQTYLRNDGSQCPFCESDEIEGDSFDFESGSVSQPVQCLACRKQWIDVYTLSDVEEVDAWNGASLAGAVDSPSFTYPSSKPGDQRVDDTRTEEWSEDSDPAL